MTSKRWASLAATILIAAAGGGLATLAGLPASWLCGAMIAATAASFAGLDTRMPLRLVDAVFIVLGISLGSGVTPEVIDGVVAWPVSLAGLAVSVVVAVVAVRAFLVRVAGWDRDTAFFSAVPGALSYVLAVASETRCDLRRVAVSQSIRVFLLVAVLPSLVVAAESGRPVTVPGVIASPLDILILLVAAGAVAFVFKLIHVPAALLTGGLLASAVLHGTGVVAGALPVPVVTASFVFLGCLIGSRFVGTRVGYLKEVALASIGAFVIATVLALGIAFVVALVTGAPADQMILAYAPGGLDAMTTLALALNMDSAFVAAHQLARFAGIALTLPIAARKALARGREKPAE